MWQRFSLYDLRVIGHYLGTLTQLFAALMAVPLLTAIVFQEWEPARRYLLGIGIALVFGTLLQFLRIEPGRLGRRQALAVTGFAWIVLAFFASIPLFLSGHYATYMTRFSTACPASPRRALPSRSTSTTSPTPTTCSAS